MHNRNPISFRANNVDKHTACISIKANMQDIPAGIYLVVLKSPTQTHTQSMQVVK